MAKTAAAPAAAAPPRRQRLTAGARKSSILKAARRAFTETGDMNGTTIKMIAEYSGISEGVIYRHFESKDQLYYEAVVEPLRAAVDDLVAASAAVGWEAPLTPAEQLETVNGLYRQLIASLEDVLPLLGLVLFGDPQVARRFYREHFAVALDRLAQAWSDTAARFGIELEAPEVSARAVMGTAMILALESRHVPKFDQERAVSLVSQGTMNGYFPAVEAIRRRR